MTTLSPDTMLNAIRREIDLIDDQILDLLISRFAATRRVKASKASDGSIASSPFRPAREAAMLRRLIGRNDASISPELLVLLWRVILSASTQSQAPIIVHMDGPLGRDPESRLLIGQHFCGMRVELHDGARLALQTLHGKRGDLAVIAPASDWAEGFGKDEPNGARVIGTLPVLSGGGRPQLLIFGHAEPQPSGDDETLIVSAGAAPEFPSALWQAEAGRWTLTGLPGFLDGGHPLLRDSLARLSGAYIAGRYPRPIKVST